MIARAVTLLTVVFISAAGLAGCTQDPSNGSNAADNSTAPANGSSPAASNADDSPASNSAASNGATEPAAPTWTPPADPKQTHFLGLVADKPVTWIEHPGATSMEITRFTVPGREGTAAAEIVVFYFGEGQGGSIDANIERWRNQFRPNDDGTLNEPMIDTITAGSDIEVTLVEFLGDWRKMGAAAYTPDQQFITAIVHSPRGMVFIRFVGDAATVGPNRNAFIDMMRSLRVE